MVDTNTKGPVSTDSSQRSTKAEAKRASSGDEKHQGRLRGIFQRALELEASDVHLIPEYPASFRIQGRIQPGADAPLDPDEIVRMLREHDLAIQARSERSRSKVLHVNQQVRVAIRTGKLESIDSAIQTGKRDGMVLLDDDLRRLVGLGKISLETARRFAQEPDSVRASGTSW